MRLALAGAVLAVALAAGSGSADDGGGLIGSARGIPAYARVTQIGQMPAAPGYPHTGFLGVADFNGDGRPDILATRAQWKSGTLYNPVVFVNNGHGGYIDGTSAIFSGAPPLTMDPRRVFITDFNRDGRPDVFLADEGPDNGMGGYHDTLILSAPGGKLVDATGNLPPFVDPSGWETSHGGAVGDVNGDGAPDIFLGRIGGTRGNGILLNDGNGHFTREADSIPDELRGGCSVILSSTIADLNGDGMQDLVVGGGTNPCQPVPTAVLLNDGHGRFPSLTVLPQPPYRFDSPIDLQAGDLNGDGSPDLVLGYNKQSFTGLWLQILINDGHGNFTDETAQRLPPQSDNDFGGFYNWIKLVDLNGDGHLDIATGLETGADHTSPYFLNDGAGHFTALPENLGFGMDDTYTLADMGGYRGLDMVFGEASIAIAKAVKPSGRLYVTIGPGDYFSFVDESGTSVRTIRPGLRTLVMWDRSPGSAFRIRGPGIDYTYDDTTAIAYDDVAFAAKRTYRFSVTAPARTGSFRTTPRIRRSRDTSATRPPR